MRNLLKELVGSSQLLVQCTFW